MSTSAAATPTQYAVSSASAAPHNEFSFYQYNPSIAAAAIFIFLFLATTAWHCLQTSKKRTFYFIPLIVGGCFEWWGYIARIFAHYNMDSQGVFIAQTLLLLLPPSLFAASIYMILGRLIHFTSGESMAPIRAERLSKIFVGGDVIAFLLQAGGGSMLAKAATQDTGKIVVIVGLLVQIGFFGLFVVTSFIFHRRMSGSPTSASMRGNWQRYMYALYGASALILVRSVFRIAEFAGGHESTLMSNEVYMYVFDGVLMVGVMVIFNVIHPGEIIGRNRHLKGTMSLGEMESEQEDRTESFIRGR
ncbi:hypothetical protein PZA11_000971 [Diplocarpon coronariae]